MRICTLNASGPTLLSSEHLPHDAHAHGKGMGFSPAPPALLFFPLSFFIFSLRRLNPRKSGKIVLGKNPYGSRLMASGARRLRLPCARENLGWAKRHRENIWVTIVSPPQIHCTGSSCHTGPQQDCLRAVTLAVLGVSDAGLAPVSANSSTGGGFGISVELGHVLVLYSCHG